MVFFSSDSHQTARSWRALMQFVATNNLTSSQVNAVADMMASQRAVAAQNVASRGCFRPNGPTRKPNVLMSGTAKVWRKEPTARAGKKLRRNQPFRKSFHRGRAVCPAKERASAAIDLCVPATMQWEIMRTKALQVPAAIQRLTRSTGQLTLSVTEWRIRAATEQHHASRAED
jgi:hypothetical protein